MAPFQTAIDMSNFAENVCGNGERELSTTILLENGIEDPFGESEEFAKR